MKKLLYACFVVALALVCASTGWGQATGSFSGTVSDKSGAVVSGASVKATSQGTGASREARTDDAGHYLIPLLPVGIYTLRVELQGFQAVETKDLRLQVDEARELNFSLVPSAVATQVEVSASAVAVETSNPSLGQVITAQEVSQLPLNGRDFVQLATLTPGTVQETNTGSFFNGGGSSEVSARGSFSLSVGGSRVNSSDWLLDGNDNNELTAGGIAILSSVDSIQEFKVLTYNYSAEFGTRAGPTVLVTTKSGGNDFHGSLYEFFRNTSLDAKSFFALLPEKFNLNQFGGSLGGPIRKNKTFFFLDGEQKYQLKGITFTGLVPTDAMRNGDFTNDALGNPRPVGGKGAIFNPNMAGASLNPAVHPNIFFQCNPITGNPIPANADGSQNAGVNCNKVPANLIAPIASELVALYPEPNTINQAGFFNFVNEPVRSLNDTKFDLRLDHNFSSSDSAFARFSYDQAVSYVPGGGGNGNFTESFYFASNQGILNHGRNIALSETHIFSPTTINQASGGYNRIFNYITSQGSGSCISSKLPIPIPGANLDCNASNQCVIPMISCGLTTIQMFGGYFAIGDRGFSPFTGGTNVFSFNDSLDMIRGKHNIKVGFGIRANQMNVRTKGFQDGFWSIPGGMTGDSEADFLMGLTTLAIHDQTFKGPVTGRRWKIFRPYVQDDWRVTNNLTVNLGLAWNLTTPITEVDNRQSNFDPATGKFFVPGVGGVDNYAGIQFDKTAFEPRIGLAWKPGGSDKTAIRAGYAIYHDSAWSQGAQGLWQNPPFYDESDAFSAAEALPNFATGAAGTCTFSTAACALTFKQTPGGVSISSGFAAPTTPTQPNFTDFTGTIFAQNRDFKLGMVQQFNINVERQLPGQIVLTAGYVGSRGSHILIDSNNLNITTPSACGTVSGYTLGCAPGGTALPLPYPAFPFSIILNVSDQGRAHYNAFQVKAETKSSRYGIYALVGYTYSNTYDNGFGDGLATSIGATYYPLPNFNKLDWGLSQINLNQNFTASVIYDLPFGKGKHFGNGWNGPIDNILGNWQVTVIEKITSGFPVFVVDSLDNSGVFFQQENNGVNLNRPNIASGCNLSGPKTIAEWFNTACFVAPPAGELGNASRTPVNGPDFVNTDFSVIKQFKLPRENMGLNFRVEFFNLFNHPQFATPGADINAGGFGAISSTVNNPRVLQFGLKLTF